jgi:ATP-binding cassette subfamily C protein
MPTGVIRFENVSFNHAGDDVDETARGIRNCNLVIAPGEIVGIKGRSGSGKTTILDILVGLLTPQSGQVTVGGDPLKGEARTAWRLGLSYAAQDPFLFHATVRTNLEWQNADEAAMWGALELCGAAQLVRNMEHGLDTVLGERGALVSGGERQRIALARALVRRPSLLVMDEATSALDAASEHAILENLRAMKDRPTIVLVSHRPENFSSCGRVIDLDKCAS